MSFPNDTRIQQLLLKAQSVVGTVEALTSTEGGFRLAESAVPNYKPERTQLAVARESLSPVGSVGGVQPLEIAVKAYLNTNDVVASALDFQVALLMAGCSVVAAKKIAIGAITTGPILRNGTITGTTSSATGRVLRPAKTGDAFIYYLPITGTFAAETITSAGASCTSSAVPAAAGWLVAPTAPGFIASGQLEEDGYIYRFRDAAATMSMDLEVGKPGTLSFGISGAKSFLGSGALTSGITLNTGLPPAWMGGGLMIDTITPTGCSKIGFDTAVKLAQRLDASIPGGVLGYRMTSRDPSLKLTFEMMDSATYDFFNKVDGDTKVPISFNVGTAVGRRVDCFFDAAEFDVPSLSNAAELRTGEFAFKPTSAVANREWEVLFA